MAIDRELVEWAARRVVEQHETRPPALGTYGLGELDAPAPAWRPGCAHCRPTLPPSECPAYRAALSGNSRALYVVDQGAPPVRGGAPGPAPHAPGVTR